MPDQPDITTRLRQTRANMLGTDDEPHYWDCHEAADEIERLRLTDAERPIPAGAPIDILADYRYWRSRQEERIGTHSPECHVWPRHERCMIHRLAMELERTRAALVAVATQDGTLAVSDGRLFVDVAGVEELAFDYTPPTHATPGPGEGTCPPSR